MLFPYPSEVDFDNYKEDLSNPKAYYGLPQKVVFCKSCVISNQRPSSTVEFKNDGKKNKVVINFANDGICDACKVKESKKIIDWEKREEELKELCNKFRRNDGQYDCLVPGSGGKDSFMQAHLLKYKYNMNPLTVTWAPHIYTDWGFKNHQAWIHAGFDNILFTPNGLIHRLITRLSVENLFHPFQPFILGQKNIAPKFAALFDINLVFYGENEAEYGNPKLDMENATRSWDYFTSGLDDEIFLGGSSLSQLKELGLTKVDWKPYLPEDPGVVEKKGIEIHYLGYYLKWHPQSAYYYAVENGNFQSSPERTTGTYSTYNSLDDKIDDFHYHTTYIKFGIGRATYDSSQEVRSGDITREEGKSLIAKYDGEFPERWANEIFEYLSIPEDKMPIAAKHFENPIFDRNYYERLSNMYRSPHLWKYSKEKKWELRHPINNENDNLSFQARDEVSNWEGNIFKE